MPVRTGFTAARNYQLKAVGIDCNTRKFQNNRHVALIVLRDIRESPRKSCEIKTRRTRIYGKHRNPACWAHARTIARKHKTHK